MQGSPFGAYGLNVSILLVGIMIGIGGLILGIGYALNDKRMKEFGKNEIIQSLINGALVGGFLILFINGGLVDTLINEAVLGNGTQISCNSFMQSNSAICFAYDYLIGPNKYYFLGGYHDSILSSLILLISLLTSVYAVLGLTKIFLAPILTQIQTGVQILGTAAISATVQASVLMYISVSALTVILPLGLVLRIFYPTRNLGSFLIALTIGLYIVLPLTYLMNATILNFYASATGDPAIVMLNANATIIKNLGMNYTSQGANGSGIVPILANLGSNAANDVQGFLNGIFTVSSSFILSAFILPAFSLMLTGISVREISKLLSSEAFFGKYNLL